MLRRESDLAAPRKRDFRFDESDAVLCFDNLEQIQRVRVELRRPRARTKFAKQSADL